jgi:hypothetical protein
MATEHQKSRYAKLSLELRTITLRTSCFSILVMEIFTVIQTYGMLNEDLKVAQPDVWHGIVLMAVLPVMFIHHAARLVKRIFTTTLYLRLTNEPLTWCYSAFMPGFVDLFLIPEFGCMCFTCSHFLTQ